MAFGLKLQKLPKDEIDERVQEAAADPRASTSCSARKPAALSGGQRQRVAMGRAIVRHPQVFLMDEPLSNLDAKLRVQMRSEIARIQHDLGVTTIYVTHDQTEAMTMGDRVAVIRKGMLQQVDSPAGALRAPGQPVRGRVHRLAGDEPLRRHARRGDGDGLAVEFGGFRLPVPDEVVAERPDLRELRRPRRSCWASGPRTWRTPRSSATRRRSGASRRRVELREALGSDVVVHVDDRRAARDDRRREGARRPTSARRRSSTSQQQAAGGQTDGARPPQPAHARRQGRADRAGGRHPPAPLLRPRRRLRDLRHRTRRRLMTTNPRHTRRRRT